MRQAAYPFRQFYVANPGCPHQGRKLMAELPLNILMKAFAK
jgi:hypothetical protein